MILKIKAALLALVKTIFILWLFVYWALAAAPQFRYLVFWTWAVPLMVIAISLMLWGAYDSSKTGLRRRKSHREAALWLESMGASGSAREHWRKAKYWS